MKLSSFRIVYQRTLQSLSQQPRRRHAWFLGFTLVILIALIAIPGMPLHRTFNTDPGHVRPVGLLVETDQPEAPSHIVVQSGDRFELHLDQAGIAAWYDLQRDPERRHNLVIAGTHLLEHKPATGAVPLSGTLTLKEQSPVRTLVAWEGQVGTPPQPFTVDYTIWAGGQVAVTLDSAQEVHTTLRTDRQAITGSALQEHPSPADSGDTSTQSFMLFLDAWTGENTAPLPTASESPPAAPLPDTADQSNLSATATPATTPVPQSQPAVASLTYNPQSGAIETQAAPDQPLQIELPAEVALRQPRFEVADWSSPDLTVQRDDTVLVAGQDYLADWDAETEQLTMQYLKPVVDTGYRATRTFTLSAEPPAPTLGLSISGHTLDEQGQLIIDANLPDLGGTPTTHDIFHVPYIQSSPDFTAEAVLQNAPDGAGVEFVLTLADGSTETITDFSAPYAATFTMPVFGEHRLNAYMLNADSTRLLETGSSDSINPLGYGRMLMSIGDSITAGKYGDMVENSDPGYPVTGCSTDPNDPDYLPAAERSADCRNFYQYDNARDTERPFYRSFHADLNDNLTACSAAPVFILNNGISGMTVAGVVNRIPEYQDHIDKLGVSSVLLQIGTNDVSSGLDRYTWRSRLSNAIESLQSPDPDLNIWVARLPWRLDGYTGDLTSQYNEMVPQLVSERHSSSDPVYLGPDFYTYFRNNTDQMSDALHPNQAGFVAMADMWQDSVCGAFNGTLPTPISTATPGSSAGLITNLTVSSGRSTSIATLTESEPVYTDRSYLFTAIPSAYVGQPFIRTANDDKSQETDNYLQFNLTAPATVYVVYDERATVLPAWLDDGSWTLTADRIGSTDYKDTSRNRVVYAQDFAAGPVVLGGNMMAPMAGVETNYTVIVVAADTSEQPTATNTPTATETPEDPAIATNTPTNTPTQTATMTSTPVTSGDLITGLTVSSGATYPVEILTEGELVYIDRSYLFTAIPSAYVGQPFIRTANDDKSQETDNYLQFNLTAPATVYVVYDERATVLPAWLDDGSWTLTADRIGSTDYKDTSRNRVVYAQDFAAGPVVLGGNMMAPAEGVGTNYTVVVVAADTSEQPTSTPTTTDTPTNTPTNTPTPEDPATATNTPTNTSTPEDPATATSTPTTTQTPTNTPTPEDPATATNTPTATSTPKTSSGPTDMLAYWKLDEDGTTGVPPFADSYADHDGTGCAQGTCPVPVPGIVNGGQAFDGSATGITVPAAAAFDWEAADSFSIVIWMRGIDGETCNGMNISANEVIVGRDDSSTGLHWWVGCRHTSGAAAFQLRDATGTGTFLSSGPSIVDGAWHHLVAVRDADLGMNRLYVDGVEVAAQTQSHGAGFSSTADLTLGRLMLDKGFHFNGTLDEVALYTQALTADEVQQLYMRGLDGIGYSD